MSASKFRAYMEGELPNLEFRSTKEEALADAVARAVSDGAMKLPHPPNIIVEAVRDPELSDFLSFDQLVSLLRENMAEKVGNDDALSNTAMVDALYNELGLMYRLNDAAKEVGLRIDGFIVVSTYVSRDWHGNVAENEA